MNPIVIRALKTLVAVGTIVLPFVDSHLQTKDMQRYMDIAAERAVAEALKKKKR